MQKEYIRTNATKHIDRKYAAWVAQENGKSVNVQPIPSHDNTADIFTKSLARIAHERHVRGLGMVSLEEFKSTTSAARGNSG